MAVGLTSWLPAHARASTSVRRSHDGARKEGGKEPPSQTAHGDGKEGKEGKKSFPPPQQPRASVKGRKQEMKKDQQNSSQAELEEERYVRNTVEAGPGRIRRTCGGGGGGGGGGGAR